MTIGRGGYITLVDTARQESQGRYNKPGRGGFNRQQAVVAQGRGGYN